MITLVDPKLLDVEFTALSTALEAITWLDKAYGKVSKQYIYKEKIDTRGVNNQFFSYKDLAYPAVRVNNKDYINLFPNEKLGNYSFFHVFGQQKIDEQPPRFRHTVDFSIIFFWDYRTAYNDDNGYSIENIKSDVLEALKIHPSVRVTSWEEDPVSVYRGFDARETEVKHYMYPYGILRLNATLRYSDRACY